MRKCIKTRVLATMMVMMTMVSVLLTGCGTENVTGTYVVSEVSENTPYILPKEYTNMFLKSEVCQIEFMSDGSIIVTASDEGETVFTGSKDKYSFVDGKMKITAPLGTMAISTYDINGKSMTLTDTEGNYVILKKE